MGSVLASSENLQRVGFLVVLPGLVRHLGVDPGDVLAAAGLDRHALDDPEGTIPYKAMGRLIEIAMEQTRCSHLGLLIGQQINAASLGLVGQFMQSAPTVGIGLRDFAFHQHRNAHGGIAYLLTDGASAFFGYAVYQRDVQGLDLICDGAAAAAFNLVRDLTPPRSTHEIEVFLSRPKPLDVKPYLSVFGVKVHFDAEQTGVAFPRSWLDDPVKGADPALRAALKVRVEAFFPAGELDILTQVRRALRVGLLTGDISADEIAAHFGITQRTLHRRLAASGLNFQALLDEARFEFAQQLIGGTRISITEIGHILRYGDSSAFTRAFVRWARATPTAWRSRDPAPLST